jgi:hypothetical protein
MVSITVQLNFDYALSFRFFFLWQLLTDTGARSQLKYRIFEFDYGKVKPGDKYGSGQLFQYQKSIDGFDGSVYTGSFQVETKL